MIRMKFKPSPSVIRCPSCRDFQDAKADSDGNRQRARLQCDMAKGHTGKHESFAGREWS